MAKNGVATHDHVNAGSDHRRRVNQSRNGRRAGHGVGQPNKQRNLRTLTSGADKKKDGNRTYSPGEQGMPRERIGTRQSSDNLQRACLPKKADRPRERENEHNAEDKTPVTHAVCDECLLRCITGFLAIKVVTNQQVGTKPDAFPADKHQEKIVGQDQGQHREHEQIQIGEEAIEAFVAAHVADCEDVNQESNERDEESIDTTQPVHRQTKVRAELAHLNPCPEVIEERRFALQGATVFEREIERNDRRNAYGTTGHGSNKLFTAHTPANEPIDGRTRKRGKDD